MSDDGLYKRRTFWEKLRPAPKYRFAAVLRSGRKWHRYGFVEWCLLYEPLTVLWALGRLLFVK